MILFGSQKQERWQNTQNITGIIGYRYNTQNYRYNATFGAKKQEEICAYMYLLASQLTQ